MEEYAERLCVDYKNLSKKFSEQTPDFNKQYCNIYLVRLKQMSRLLEEKIAKKWKGAYPTCKLHKLSEEKYSKCVVFGTLFKDQKLKPSILKQLSEANGLVPQPIVSHFTDKSDQIFVEDELQRYQLVGFPKLEEVVTGISCALLGTDDGKGKFIVEDYVFAGYRPQIELSLASDPVPYAVILSGLDLVNASNFAMNLQLMVYWLNGLIENDIGPQIVRVIIAGNCIKIKSEITQSDNPMLSRRPEPSDCMDAVKLLDKLLFWLCGTVPIDVMPGENDPSNHILPQKPMHHCMFSKSYQYKSLSLVPNPYYCSLGGTKIMGTSGQPISDIMRYSEISDPLDALESCLEWSHLAPTAPDTLGCFPFYDSDPFVIEDCPHVLFAGNQKEFATKECIGPEGQRVRLISVPEFGTTYEICLLNLKTLDCEKMSFEVS